MPSNPTPSLKPYSKGITCDVNCALDAVVKGQKATSANLENMFKGLTTNMERLHAYWGKVQTNLYVRMRQAVHRLNLTQRL